MSIALAYAKEKPGGKGTDFEVRMGLNKNKGLLSEENMNLWKLCRFLISKTMMNRLGLNLIGIINGIHRMVKGLR